jgi:hypothetical protein
LDFDVIDSARRGQSISRTVVDCYRRLGLIAHFNINTTELEQFVTAVEDSYRSQRHETAPAEIPSYHNWDHAGDVTQMAAAFVANTKAAQLLSPLKQLALITAACCHDLGHGGLNNAVLRATGDPLTEQYGNDAPLEQYHSHLARQLIEHNHTVFLKALTNDAERSEFITDVTTLILATDMSKHNEIVAELLKIKVQEPLGGAATNAQQLMLMKILLKCADISNVAKPFEASRDRAIRLAAEFESVGEFQKMHGLPVDKLNVETSTHLGGMSAGFITYVALPMFDALQDWMPSARRITGRVRANEMLWQRIRRQEEKEERRITKKAMPVGGAVASEGGSL